MKFVPRTVSVQSVTRRAAHGHLPVLTRPMILLPRGPRGGVGQLSTPDGPTVLPAETVSQYKGGDLFTAQFAQLFGPA